MSAFTYAPPAGPIRLLYLDDDILVACKPAGLLSVPGRGADRADCLIARLRAGHGDVLLVHRLDLDTSGLVVMACNPRAQAHLGRQFEERRVSKRYIALVAGVPQEARGRIDLPLVVDWPNRPRQKICHETGRPARTDWRLLRREAGNARMQLKPVTGRSHQLRVHMLALGHPILGDPLYATGGAAAFPRMMLHAESLSLVHPATGERMRFQSQVPF